MKNTAPKATHPHQEVALQLGASPHARGAAEIRGYRWGRVNAFPVAWAGANLHQDHSAGPSETIPTSFPQAPPLIATIKGWSRKTGFVLDLWAGAAQVQASAASGVPVLPALIGIAKGYREAEWPDPLSVLWGRATTEAMTAEARRTDVLSAALCAALKRDAEVDVVALLTAGASAQMVPAGLSYSALTMVLRRHAGARSSSDQESTRVRLLHLLLAHGRLHWGDEEEAPLHQAIALNRPHDLATLLTFAGPRGLPLHPRGNYGETPLHRMLAVPKAGAGSAFDAAIGHCLTKGRISDLMRCNRNGWSPLGLLIRNGNSEVVRVLLDRRVRPGPDALWAALEKKDAALVAELLKAGARPDKPVLGLGGLVSIAPLARTANPPELQALLVTWLLDKRVSAGRSAPRRPRL